LVNWLSQHSGTRFTKTYPKLPDVLYPLHGEWLVLTRLKEAGWCIPLWRFGWNPVSLAEVSWRKKGALLSFLQPLLG